MRNHDFEQPPTVPSDRRKRKASENGDKTHATPVAGFYHRGLTNELRESLVEYCRHSTLKARKDGRVALEVRTYTNLP